MRAPTSASLAGSRLISANLGQVVHCGDPTAAKARAEEQPEGELSLATVSHSTDSTIGGGGGGGGGAGGGGEAGGDPYPISEQSRCPPMRSEMRSEARGGGRHARACDQCDEANSPHKALRFSGAETAGDPTSDESRRRSCASDDVARRAVPPSAPHSPPVSGRAALRFLGAGKRDYTPTHSTLQPSKPWRRRTLASSSTRSARASRQAGLWPPLLLLLPCVSHTAPLSLAAQAIFPRTYVHVSAAGKEERPLFGDLISAIESEIDARGGGGGRLRPTFGRYQPGAKYAEPLDAAATPGGRPRMHRPPSSIASSVTSPYSRRRSASTGHALAFGLGEARASRGALAVLPSAPPTCSSLLGAGSPSCVGSRTSGDSTPMHKSLIRS